MMKQRYGRKLAYAHMNNETLALRINTEVYNKPIGTTDEQTLTHYSGGRNHGCGPVGIARQIYPSRLCEDYFNRWKDDDTFCRLIGLHG